MHLKSFGERGSLLFKHFKIFFIASVVQEVCCIAMEKGFAKYRE
jgi:hypothetical protein